MDVKLVMFRESGEQRVFPISNGVTKIGRKDDCEIRIPVAEVSRNHCEIRNSPSKVEIKDLGSANGTFVNNKRVSTQGLAAGDHLVVGPVVFTVQVNGQPKDIKPVKTRLKTRAGAATDGSTSSDDSDPISALEALASSADQTALDPFDDEDDDEI